MSRNALEAELLEAHSRKDGARLARGYTLAADRAESENDNERACFFLTQAWVFALEAGDPIAMELKKRLVRHGRETWR